MPALLSLVAPVYVVMKNYGATSDDKDENTTLRFQSDGYKGDKSCQ